MVSPWMVEGTIIQSLTQMRALAIVDDSPDLATAIDARISFSKARRYVLQLCAFIHVNQMG